MESLTYYLSIRPTPSDHFQFVIILTHPYIPIFPFRPGKYRLLIYYSQPYRSISIASNNHIKFINYRPSFSQQPFFLIILSVCLRNKTKYRSAFELGIPNVKAGWLIGMSTNKDTPLIAQESRFLWYFRNFAASLTSISKKSYSVFFEPCKGAMSVLVDQLVERRPG